MCAHVNVHSPLTLPCSAPALPSNGLGCFCRFACLRTRVCVYVCVCVCVCVFTHVSLDLGLSRPRPLYLSTSPGLSVRRFQNVSESAATRLVTRRRTKFTEHNIFKLTRVYPNGKRYDHSVLFAWACACACVRACVRACVLLSLLPLNLFALAFTCLCLRLSRRLQSGFAEFQSDSVLERRLSIG